MWLLTRNPQSAAVGRVYAAYGGVCVVVAPVWRALVERVMPMRRDLLGVALCLAGMVGDYARAPEALGR